MFPGRIGKKMLGILKVLGEGMVMVQTDKSFTVSTVFRMCRRPEVQKLISNPKFFWFGVFQPWDLSMQTLRWIRPSVTAHGGVIMSCCFCLKWVWTVSWPVWCCVCRDLLRLGGTLPGHNRKSPDNSQEIIRQQMSQTLPIRVWTAAKQRIQNE